MPEKMNSMERTLCTLGHKEPDRVPLFLLLSLYGAKESGLSVKNYFSQAENVVKTQIRMKEKYNNDCYYTFFYAGLEVEAWGGKVIFTPEGPPNTGTPIIRQASDIDTLEVPYLEEVEGIKRQLEVTRELYKRSSGNTPIIGVVMSPFSLPVMQMGFEAYLNLIYKDPERFNHLMRINQEFCRKWDKAQRDAGATAICYFNPLSSPDIIHKELYLKTGYRVDSDLLSHVEGSVAFHLASGRVLPIIDEIIQMKCAVLSIGEDEDLVALKKASKGRISLLGNLSGIEMRNWSEETVRQKVKIVIDKLAPGGGFILSDYHGEIPYQVPEDVLLGISRAVKEYGTYPLPSEGLN